MLDDRVVSIKPMIKNALCFINVFFHLCYHSFFFFFLMKQSLPPDRAPEILDLDSNLEWNLNSSPKIYCSATGNPLPSHNSIELRKLDSTVLKVRRPTLMPIIPSQCETYSSHSDHHKICHTVCVTIPTIQ